MHKRYEWVAALVLSAVGAAGCVVGGEPVAEDLSPATGSELQAESASAAAPSAAIKAPREFPPGPTETVKAAMKAAMSGAPAKPEPASKAGSNGIIAMSPLPSLTGAVAVPASLCPSQTSTITATASSDIGPTPYFLRIWDSSAQAYIAQCGSGTSCSATVTSSTIQNKVYYVVLDDSQGNQPHPDQDWTWVFVDWATGLALSESAHQVPVGTSVALTASALCNVAPTPYYLTLYDATTSALVGACGSGSSCTVSVSQSVATTHQYVACFSGLSSTYKPPSALECTQLDPVTWTNSGISVSLSAPPGTSGSETVTATASIDVGPTPYYIEIFDIETGLVTRCPSGTTCTATFTPAVGVNHLVAFVAGFGTTLLPPNIQAESAIVVTTGFPPPPG